MTGNTLPSIVEVNGDGLKTKDFTDSGVRQFSTTVLEYADKLLNRASHYGEAGKAPGMAAEISHDHVRAAAVSIARSYGVPARSGWSVAGQVGEYLATAVAGVGGGHLDTGAGVIAFGLGLVIAVILVSVRLGRGKGE